MKIISLILLLAAALLSVAEASATCRISSGNPPDFAQAVLYLTGASDLESVPENEAERFRDLAERPLAINLASRSRLLSSGLFSAYQVATLIDYRNRSGDILSFRELSLVDGFSEEAVEALSFFISLESYNLPGQRPDHKTELRNSLELSQTTKGSYPFDGGRPDYPWSYSGRYRLTSEQKFDVGVSVKRYDADKNSRPSSYTVSGAYFGRKHLEQIVLGDMSLRFGQGLALWTGFTVGGISGERSFWRRPSGISLSRSYSAASSVRAAAASFAFGPFGFSLFMSMPGLRGWCESGEMLDYTLVPGGNITWYSKYGQVGVTYFHTFEDLPKGNRNSKVSADARFCVRGTELFGEVAYDIINNIGAVTAGFMTPIADNVKTALTLRHLPRGYGTAWTAPVRMWTGKKGESGVAVGLFVRKLELSADAAFQEVWEKRQLKASLVLPWQITPDVFLSMKLQERLRSYGAPNRTEFRCDVKYNYGRWMTAARADVIVSDAFAWLAYAEESYTGRLGAVFLRGTVFVADNWNDRIYCYERDAPGSFNIPAYYGRGWAASLVARLKLRADYRGGGSELNNNEMRTRNRGNKRVVSWKLYARAGFTDCPWPSPGQKKPRPAKSELKFMLACDF